LAGLILLAPESGCSTAFLRDALLAVRHASSALRAGRSLLATVSRLDGAFGFQAIDTQRQPLDGALAGLLKTAAREWPEVHCKAIDLAPHWPAIDAACDALAAELLLAGPVEVGLSPTASSTLALAQQPLPIAASAPIQIGDVVLVTGGARGVTAAAAISLAKAFRPTLILLGRTNTDIPEPPSLTNCATEAELLRELHRLTPGQSPRQLTDQAHDILAQREVRATLAAIQQVGAKAVYQQIDVRDQPDIASLLQKIRREHGPIRGLIHGAGVLADARLEDKTAEQFDRVFSTKIDGLYSLLSTLDLADLRAVVLFSSTTARLGRVGQADYAMANEVLNKTAQQLARRLPACRVLAVNWGPWAGGMVTPALRKLFDSEGIGLIPLDQGADYLARELASRDAAVEVVILGTPTAQPETSPPAASVTPDSQSTAPTLARPLARAFERVLDLANSPILESHVLDGRAVLPLALTLEYLAHGATVQNPGLHFHGIDDLRVLHGVVLDPSSSVTLTIGTGKAVRKDSVYVVPTEMRGTRAGGKEVLFARADVLLTSQLPAAPTASPAAHLPAYPHSIEKIYRDLLFHGPDLQGLEQIEGCGPDGIAAQVRTAPPPATWLVRPLRQRWLADPLIIDTAFQMLILWSLERRRVGNLPSFVARYRQFVRSFPTDGVRISAHVLRQTDMQAVSNLDISDLTGRLIARIEGLECTLDDNLARAFRRNRLAGAATL
jgi:NAD(P)-dependent dehydrogenase (short-subunit alcohol dehydrogenase family)